MIKKIETWNENVYGFEGHNRAECGARSLCLEKIICLAKEIESGKNIDPVLMIHYKTSRMKTKNKFKKVKINKHNYDLAMPSFGKLGDSGGGHHRTFAYQITHIPQPIEEISNDDWTKTQIHESIKKSFKEMKIASDYSQVQDMPCKYKIPNELANTKRFPTQKEISNFFKERQDKKITYNEIIENLYT